MSYSSNTSETKVGCFIIIMFFVVAWIFGSIGYNNVSNERVIVQKIDMQSIVSGGGNQSSVNTEIVYRVFTDKGLYQIEQEGIWYAHPELISQIHEGDTLDIEARGWNCVALGWYKSIVKAEKVQNSNN